MKKSILPIIIIVIVIFAYLMFRFFNENKNQEYQADYKYLDRLKIINPLNINRIKVNGIKDYQINSYIYSIKVDDLDGDNKKEIVYISGGKVFILDNNWNQLFDCFVGDYYNDRNNMLIDDINNDGFKEIITIGGEKSIFEKTLRKHLGATGYSGKNFKKDNKEYYRIEFFGKIDQDFLAELRQYVDDIEVIGQNELIMSEESEEYLYSENYSLKILDHKCNLISKYFILPRKESLDIIFSQNLDNDPDKEIIIKLKYGTDDIYVLNNNKLELNNEDKIKDLVNKQRFPISEEKIKKYKIGERIFLEDINNDGVEEIIALAQEPVSYVGKTKIFVLDSSTGEVLGKYTYPTRIESASIADINNDGFKEIIVTGNIDGFFEGEPYGPITVLGVTN